MTKIVNEIANITIDDLMKHYNLKDKESLIKKAISTLKIAASVEKTKGELIARKNGNEVKIII